MGSPQFQRSFDAELFLEIPEKRLGSVCNQILDQFPEETFCFFNEGDFRRRIATIQDSFLPDQSNRRIAYAVKANPQKRFLEVLNDEGITTFDCASEGEIQRVLSINPVAEILFNHPIKTRQSIRNAAERGVSHFTIQSITELEKIAHSVSPFLSSHAFEIAVRLQTPNNEAKVNLSSKYGAEVQDASETIAYIKNRFSGNFVPGISMHVGSQNTDISQYDKGIRLMADIARSQGGVKTLNVGGGVPVNYENDPHFDIRLYFRSISSALRKNIRGVLTFSDSRIFIELGRAFIADSIDLVIPILAREKRNGKPCVYMNDGVFTSFSDSAVHGWQYFFEFLGKNGRKLSTHKIPFTVFGRTCDSGDVLGEILLPENIDEGDFLHVPKAGAYMDSQGTDFNGFNKPKYVAYNIN